MINFNTYKVQCNDQVSVDLLVVGVGYDSAELCRQ